MKNEIKIVYYWSNGLFVLTASFESNWDTCKRSASILFLYCGSLKIGFCSKQTFFKVENVFNFATSANEDMLLYDNYNYIFNIKLG